MCFLLCASEAHMKELKIQAHAPATAVQTKSDREVIFCFQLLSKTLICTPHLSQRESIYHMCINPILQIG